MRLLFLGSERIRSTTTEGKDESEAACSASNKLGVGALALVNKPEASHNRTSRAKIEAIFRFFFIIPVTLRRERRCNSGHRHMMQVNNEAECKVWVYTAVMCAFRFDSTRNER